MVIHCGKGSLLLFFQLNGLDGANLHASRTGITFFLVHPGQLIDDSQDSFLSSSVFEVFLINNLGYIFVNKNFFASISCLTYNSIKFSANKPNDIAVGTNE